MELIFNKWANILLRPKEAFKEEKGKADLVKSIICAEIGGVVIFLFMLATIFFNPQPDGTGIGLLVLFLFIIPFTLPIIQLFIISGLHFIVARLVGGKGSFIAQTYLFSLVLSLLYASAVLIIIPIIGFIAVILLVLYSLYLIMIMLMEVHEFDSLKALITLIIALVGPSIILLILSSVVLLLFMR